ncbi:unnamed protein product [marine sediment metagenome]|uniref:Uncharacterized protein n=1 Tax=marine sediment metagenome TaxID=412755 RepID=X0VI63_9ZZZZ
MRVKNNALKVPLVDSRIPIVLKVLAIPLANTLAGPATRVKPSSGLKVPDVTPKVAAKMITNATRMVSPNILPVVIGMTNGSFSTWCDVENVVTRACHPEIAPLDRVTNNIGQIGPRSGW